MRDVIQKKQMLLSELVRLTGLLRGIEMSIAGMHQQVTLRTCAIRPGGNQIRKIQ